MEGCLLCLEIHKELVDYIQVSSSKWQEFNIKSIIDKHLWIMESILPSSWLCNTCWEALNDFHKFYMRIEEAHMDFGKLMKTEFEPELEDIKGKQCYAEPEICINELEFEDDLPIIKEEQSEYLSEDDVPLIRKSKRRCQTKDITNNKKTTKDPLNNRKKSNKSSKCKSKKKQPSVLLNPPIEVTIQNSENKTLQMKQELEALQMSDKSDSSHSGDFDSYTDCDYNPKKNNKRSMKSKKKQLARNINSSDSDDSNTDSDYKPEEEDTKRPKQTSKERDTYLAENFKISCVLCQTPMNNFKNLGKHFEMEHNQRGYAVCCRKKFYDRFNLVKHIQRHIDPSKFKCDLCGKVMTSESSLKFHHELLHLPEEEKKFPCNECGKNFASEKILSYHLKAIHSKEHVKICDICGKSLRRGFPFKRHMLEHEGKTLPTVSCEVCGLIYANKKNLTKHVRSQHPLDGKKECICKICSKVLGNNSSLSEHIRCVHSTDTHKCTICERAFKIPIRLKEHMATHTGIALYTCPWCPKTFNASGGMHAHRKRAHPVEWEHAQRQKKVDRYTNPAVMEINESEI